MNKYQANFLKKAIEDNGRKCKIIREETYTQNTKIVEYRVETFEKTALYCSFLKKIFAYYVSKEKTDIDYMIISKSKQDDVFTFY